MKATKKSQPLLVLLSCLLCVVIFPAHGFVPTANRANDATTMTRNNNPFTISTTLHVYNDDEEKEQIEEARVRIWKSRREEIRGMLKSAEKLRNFRLANGYVPELDEDGNAIGSDGKSAVTLTAFAVTAGVIILRVGGRAALVSAVGLDFISDNPEMQTQINQVLSVADGVDPLLKAGIFCLGWTFVKTLCFDAGGIALAFASGILFGGVIQGAVMSAFGATVGSSVAFALYVAWIIIACLSTTICFCRELRYLFDLTLEINFLTNNNTVVSLITFFRFLSIGPRRTHPSAKRRSKLSKKIPPCGDSKRSWPTRASKPF